VTTCTELTVQVLGECDARFGTGAEFASSAATASGDKAGERPARRRAARARRGRAGQAAPRAVAPRPGAASPDDSESPDAGSGAEDEELTSPAYGRASGAGSLRAGKTLLRFLLEDR
jgi:hypothetical protein